MVENRILQKFITKREQTASSILRERFGSVRFPKVDEKFTKITDAKDYMQLLFNSDNNSKNSSFIPLRHIEDYVITDDMFIDYNIEQDQGKFDKVSDNEYLVGLTKYGKALKFFDSISLSKVYKVDSSFKLLFPETLTTDTIRYSRDEKLALILIISIINYIKERYLTHSFQYYNPVVGRKNQPQEILLQAARTKGKLSISNDLKTIKDTTLGKAIKKNPELKDEMIKKYNNRYLTLRRKISSLTTDKLVFQKELIDFPINPDERGYFLQPKSPLNIISKQMIRKTLVYLNQGLLDIHPDKYFAKVKTIETTLYNLGIIEQEFNYGKHTYYKIKPEIEILLLNRDDIINKIIDRKLSRYSINVPYIENPRKLKIPFDNSTIESLRIQSYFALPKITDAKTGKNELAVEYLKTAMKKLGIKSSATFFRQLKDLPRIVAYKEVNKEVRDYAKYHTENSYMFDEDPTLSFVPVVKVPNSNIINNTTFRLLNDNREEMSDAVNYKLNKEDKYKLRYFVQMGMTYIPKGFEVLSIGLRISTDNYDKLKENIVNPSKRSNTLKSKFKIKIYHKPNYFDKDFVEESQLKLKVNNTNPSEISTKIVKNKIAEYWDQYTSNEYLESNTLDTIYYVVISPEDTDKRYLPKLYLTVLTEEIAKFARLLSLGNKIASEKISYQQAKSKDEFVFGNYKGVNGIKRLFTRAFKVISDSKNYEFLKDLKVKKPLSMKHTVKYMKEVLSQLKSFIEKYPRFIEQYDLADEYIAFEEFVASFDENNYINTPDMAIDIKTGDVQLPKYSEIKTKAYEIKLNTMLNKVRLIIDSKYSQYLTDTELNAVYAKAEIFGIANYMIDKFFNIMQLNKINGNYDEYYSDNFDKIQTQVFYHVVCSEGNAIAQKYGFKSVFDPVFKTDLMDKLKPVINDFEDYEILRPIIDRSYSIISNKVRLFVRYTTCIDKSPTNYVKNKQNWLFHNMPEHIFNQLKNIQMSRKSKSKLYQSKLKKIISEVMSS